MTDRIPYERVRTIFISDVHLGTRGCQASLLLDFLRQHHCEHLYLVGDIVDGWRLKSKWAWPRAHDEVVSHVLGLAHAGVKVTYVPGNHDDFLRKAQSTQFAGITVRDRAVHTTADGERYLVLHGDQFDVVSTRARWLALLGDVAYRLLLAANTRINERLTRAGLPYWSFSAWTKHHVKKIVNVISNYESNVASEAHRLGLRGIICGHIHHAALTDDNGVRYINTGDWVESCTAVVEHLDGQFEVVHWAKRHREAKRAEIHARPATLRRRFARLLLQGLVQPFTLIRRHLLHNRVEDEHHRSTH